MSKTLDQVVAAKLSAKKSKKPVIAKASKINREAWLGRAVAQLARYVFKPVGLIVPPVKVSCSWPGGGDRSTRIGECWVRAASALKINEIFISPRVADAVPALEILAHELIHAVHDGDGHGAKFKSAARAIGLEGKTTATHAGDDLKAKLVTIAEVLGAYPHAALNTAKGRKKQTTRMIKLSCPECESIFRTTRKTIEAATQEISCPFCGHDHVNVELPDEED
jgi:hypothetical protein